MAINRKGGGQRVATANATSTAFVSTVRSKVLTATIAAGDAVRRSSFRKENDG